MFLTIDLPIFKVIYSLVNKSVFLDSLAIFFARDLIYLLPLFIVLAYCLKRNSSSLKSGRTREKISKIVLLTLLNLVIISFVSFIFKEFHFRSRPFAFLNFYPLIDFSSTKGAFPSFHTALAFSIAFIVYFINTKIGWFSLFLAFFVGFSRIYTGVHWPTDVAAGFFFSWFSFMISKKLLKNISSPASES